MLILITSALQMRMDKGSSKHKQDKNLPDTYKIQNGIYTFTGRQ